MQYCVINNIGFLLDIESFNLSLAAAHEKTENWNVCNEGTVTDYLQYILWTRTA